MRAAPEDRCPIVGCGHALSMHNSLSYCRSKTTPDRSGECVCDGTGPVNTDSSPFAPTPPPSGGAASPRVHAQPPKHVEPGDNSDTGGGS